MSQLVYVSVRTEKCNDEEIQKILDACKRNNSDLDITGVLLYSNKNFVQYLEGEHDTIFELYDKIKEDDRHKNVVLISSSPINERSFPSWQMGAKNIDEGDVDFMTDMSSSEKETFKSLLSGNSQESNKTIALMNKFFK